MATYWSCAQTHPHREKLALVNLRRRRFTSFFPYFLLRDRRGRLVIRPRSQVAVHQAGRRPDQLGTDQFHARCDPAIDAAFT